MTQRAVWQAGWWAVARHCPSPHADERPVDVEPTLVVLHSISLPPGHYRGDAVKQLFMGRLDPDADPYFEGLRGLRVSAHFFVRRCGRVQQFVSCERRAWHAGRSVWRGRDGCNDWSIGIELEGLEGDTFEGAQYAALARLIPALARRYPVQELVGHEHIAPDRKADPGPGFDWRRLRAELRPWRAPRALHLSHTLPSTRKP